MTKKKEKRPKTKEQRIHIVNQNLNHRIENKRKSSLRNLSMIGNY